ncbi:helix-turn-helix domain-containing protein [Enterococcus sp. S86.2]|uniref:helix-turn-helix domain-containing protein n=1 Tax=Enterococcus sp. S86.2 TaxID=3031299 RepID=UPI0026EE6510|nr:helix-turn-helix domain-containing protein [Enterococcus sp. S86.2]
MTLLANFLAKEEWRKYQLLKKVERSPYFALTKKELMEELGISNYVLKSLIDQLILDLEHYQLAPEINLFVEEPFLQLEITGSASSETLLEKYVAESTSFQILAGAALGQFKSLNDLSEKKLISYPIAHSNYKNLNTYLKNFDITIDKKFRLTGKSEKNVRLFLTELFARIFKNDQDIYPVADQNMIQTKLEVLDLIKMTMHQKMKLMHYLHVTNLRIQQKKYVEWQDLSFLLPENLEKEMQTAFFYRVPSQYREAEAAAFYCYYGARSKEIGLTFALAESPQINQWSQNLLAQLIQTFPKLIKETESLAGFLTRSRYLHFQLLETSTAFESIQPEINIIYFQQNFPRVLAFCRRYISNLKQTAPDLYRKKKQLLLQYLFLILDSFPKKLILETINVYVDFSYGNLYNQFIVKNLDFFKQIGANVVPTIKDADILLTDSRELGQDYQKDCVVWLAPPRPLDWANLAQKVIQKREAKYNGENLTVTGTGGTYK